MTSDVLSDAADDKSHVRVTIEVGGLTEVWELPLTGTSLQSALVAIESIAHELRARHELAQKLERELGDGSTDPDYQPPIS